MNESGSCTREASVFNKQNKQPQHYLKRKNNKMREGGHQVQLTLFLAVSKWLKAVLFKEAISQNTACIL